MASGASGFALLMLGWSGFVCVLIMNGLSGFVLLGCSGYGRSKAVASFSL